jgi:hypothetical protein
MEKKTTKREMYGVIMEAMADNADVVAFCENEIALLDKKAIKAKERAAAKRVEGDKLTDAVRTVLTNDFAVIADITAKVAETYGEEATVARVTYRLTQLVKNGEAESGDVKIPATEGQKARTIKAYKLVD